jgi:hypothetical protein
LLKELVSLRSSVWRKWEQAAAIAQSRCSTQWLIQSSWSNDQFLHYKRCSWVPVLSPSCLFISYQWLNEWSCRNGYCWWYTQLRNARGIKQGQCSDSLSSTFK